MMSLPRICNSVTVGWLSWKGLPGFLVDFRCSGQEYSMMPDRTIKKLARTIIQRTRAQCRLTFCVMPKAHSLSSIIQNVLCALKIFCQERFVFKRRSENHCDFAVIVRRRPPIQRIKHPTVHEAKNRLPAI